MRQQTYTLFKVIAERGRFAKVTILLDKRTNNQPLILIDDSAFDACFDDRLNLPALKDGARVGVQYALQSVEQVIDTTQLTFCVTEIVAHPFDSDPGTVAYAACHATWALFNINSSTTPQLRSWLTDKLHQYPV
ncbi:hypothetical protein [Nostoc sp. FACHB-280]|uniref:hypothetical protein n=1 Tax=Nostoc sp. FACHB-280 TaxID=2692839 RepID=UPI00168AE685|nr:hypothetical protein [Nostoc sp. FACHB-280]MBD2493202.1 hypothetical protein [Nostoc sp. FACHB-280]